MKADKPFFEQTFLVKYLKHKVESRELLKFLCTEWEKTRNEGLFLILLGYSWLFTENAYLDDVFRFYNEKVYEKELLFELLKYGENNMKKSVKFWLLAGYIYSTTGYYFWGDLEDSQEKIEENGEKIISEMYMKYPEHFTIGYFYGMIHGFESMYRRYDKKKFQEIVCGLFPSKAEIDVYFRENRQKAELLFFGKDDRDSDDWSWDLCGN